MSIIDWAKSYIAGKDIIDIYFVLTDLKDIPITEQERVDGACNDALATHTAGGHHISDNMVYNSETGECMGPVGKACM